MAFEPGPLKFLLVEDEPTHAMLMTGVLNGLGARVQHVASCAAARAAATRERFDVVLLDMGLPDGSGFEIQDWLLGERHSPPVIFVTSDDTAEHAVRAVRAGAADYVVKRPEYLARLEHTVRRVLELHSLACAADPQRDPAPTDRLWGGSEEMAEVRRRVHAYAGRNAPILISGEAGTGKYRVAEALHQSSCRADGPFVVMRCRDLEGPGPGRLLGDLVGAARGGTLLLEELADAAPDLQSRLVLVADTLLGPGRPFEAPSPLDFRLLLDTRRDLAAATARGELREDLWLRASALRIQLAPLRERPGDLRTISEREIARLGRVDGRSFELTEDARAVLDAHAWPGNVRELRMALREMTILAGRRSELTGEDATRALRAVCSQARSDGGLEVRERPDASYRRGAEGWSASAAVHAGSRRRVRPVSRPRPLGLA